MKLVIWLVLLSACVQENPTEEFQTTCPGKGDFEFADTIIHGDGEVSSTSAINVPKNAINGVRGNSGAGSKDVFSRGYDLDTDNHFLILEWKDRIVINGEGPDFVIFENAFKVAENNNFMDPIVVSVSNDLVNWSTFPHDYVAGDESKYSHDPNDWIGFAGIQPTNYNSDDEACVDPMDEISGGDKFDLDRLDLTDPLRNGFRYLKLQSAPTVKQSRYLNEFCSRFYFRWFRSRWGLRTHDRASMILQTRRTNLSRVVSSDKSDIGQLYQNEEVRKYLGGCVAEESFSKNFDASLENESKDFVIRNRTDNEFIGLVNISAHCEMDSHEVSYQLLPKFWKQGYGVEILETIFEFAFKSLSFEKLCAETQMANVASVRLLEKAGMSPVRELERFGATQVIYSIDLSLDKF